MVRKFKKIETRERCRLLKQMSDAEFEKMIRGMTMGEILLDPCLQAITNIKVPGKVIIRRAPFPRGEVPAPLRPFTEGLSDILTGIKGVANREGKLIPKTAAVLADTSKRRAKKLKERPWEK